MQRVRIQARRVLSLAAMLGALCAARASAQACDPEWVPTFGTIGGFGNEVSALAVFDDGSGPALYVGGDFASIGNTGISSLARWDGNVWTPVGIGVGGPVQALSVLDDGSGLALYASSNNGTVIGKWDGTAWTLLGSSANNRVHTFEVFDDGSGAGPKLYAGGAFTTIGGVSANRFARWNGTWFAQAGGVTGGTLLAVESMKVFDDGTGPALYIGGAFNFAGPTPVNHVARWNGNTWSAVGGGVSAVFVAPRVYALEVFDDGSGSGPALYAAGLFDKAGGTNANSIARWDGAAWTPLASGIGGSVRALAVHDDGTGEALYAGGYFTTGNGAASYIARWDGNTWSSLDGGVFGQVTALASSAGEPALFVGGSFTSSSSSDVRLAKWACPPPMIAYCFGDGSGAACACGIPGQPGAGCANSTGSGATLSGLGSTDVVTDDLELRTSGMPPGTVALTFAGYHPTNSGVGQPFGDGLKCASGAVVRLGVRTADAQGVATWGPGLIGTYAWQPGDVRRFQTWYRDTAFACSGSNTSNGLEVTFR